MQPALHEAIKAFDLNTLFSYQSSWLAYLTFVHVDHGYGAILVRLRFPVREQLILPQPDLDLSGTDTENQELYVTGRSQLTGYGRWRSNMSSLGDGERWQALKNDGSLIHWR